MDLFFHFSNEFSVSMNMSFAECCVKVLFALRGDIK